MPPICSRTAQLLSSRRHPDALESLLHWFTVTRRATWEHLASVRADFPHADPVDGFTVFNIGGNKYRLVAVIK